MHRLIFLVCLVTISGCGRSNNCESLLDNVLLELQNTNHLISTVQVVDTRPRLSRYWVVARGVIASEDYDATIEDELFGVFVVDESFTQIDHVVDVFPSPKLRDYDVWITSHGPNSITVRGHGTTYHDNGIQKTYQVPD